MESWEKKTLGEVIYDVKDKYDPTADEFMDIPYVGLENIKSNCGIIGYNSSAEVKSVKTLFQKGDMLYGKLRPYLNKHDITKFDGMCSTDILVFRADDLANLEYINYLFNTRNFISYAVDNSKGINLPRTSAKDVLRFVLEVPCLDEQKEIVRILGSLLAKEARAKEAAEAVLEQVEVMKKAVLARAFRGEL